MADLIEWANLHTEEKEVNMMANHHHHHHNNNNNNNNTSIR